MFEIKHKSGYAALGEAVVVQAAYDYYNALELRYKTPGSLGSYYRVKTLEDFFKSDWCYLLSPIEPDFIISYCHKRIREKYEKVGRTIELQGV